MRPEETLRLHTTPGPYRAGIRYCGAWAVGGLLLALTGNDVCVMAGLMIALSFGLVAFLCSLSPRPGRIYLDMDPEGLREQAVNTRRAFCWRDFESFEIMNESEGGPLVAFRYSDAYQGKRAHGPFGIKWRFDGVLHDTYGMSAHELADLLNNWRLRYGPKPAAVDELIDDLL